MFRSISQNCYYFNENTTIFLLKYITSNFSAGKSNRIGNYYEKPKKYII